MSKRQLEVRANEELIGHLREDNDLWELEYAPEWVASGQGFDLSPSLSRTHGLHRDGATQRPVQWYFDNLLPEDALRATLAKEASVAAEDAFGLLTYFGAESAGSLVLHDPQRPAIVERGLKPLPYAELSKRIGDLPRASLTRAAPKKMSLAGAQHKLLVVLEDDRLFEPLAGTPSTHILKPDHQDEGYPASVMNEYFTMRLAAAVGVAVPRVWRLYVPQPVYVIERFDRLRKDGKQDVQRHHVIDTCQLLNKARIFKYTGAELDTLARAIDLCRFKAAARLQIYRWLLFNVIAGNADNHLKNMSFLVDASGINVAPAYDLLCTAVCETRTFANNEAQWPHVPLTFSLGDAKTFATITRACLLEAGDALGLGEATTKRELDRFLKDIPTEADRLIAEIEGRLENDVAASPDSETTRAHMAGERRLLAAVRHIVLADMVRRVA